MKDQYLFHSSRDFENTIHSNAVVGPFPSNPTYSFIKLYDSHDCTGELTQVTSGLLDTCFKTSQNQSYIYTCSAEGVTQNIYNDVACQSFNSTGSFLSTTCSLYIIADCSGSSDPYKQTPADFLVHTNYQDETCSSDQVLDTYSFPNNKCVDNADGTSTEYSYPSILFYNASSDCYGEYQTTPLETTCTPFTVDDYYYGNINVDSYSKYSLMPSSPSSSDGLSTGAIAGIVVGGFFALIIFVLVIYYVFVSSVVSKPPLVTQEQTESKA